MNQVQRKMALIGWMICGLGALFYCYEYLLRIEPSVMVDQIRSTFQIRADTFGFIAGLYYTAYTPMQLVVGVVTDMYGPRRVLTVAITCCVIGSFIFSITDSIFLAGLGRFIIGFGSAFAFVGVLKLASIWLPENRFALFTGLATGLGMVGAMVGDVELSRLVNTIGWKQTLHLGTFIGLVLIPVIWLVVRDKNPLNEEQNSTDDNITYKETFRNLLEIVKNKQMWLAGFIGCLLYLSLSVFAELWGIQYLQVAFNMSADQASNLNATIFLGWLIGAPVMGFLSDLIKRRKILLTFGSLLAAVCLFTIIYDPNLSTNQIGHLLFLSGFFASAQVNCFAIGRENSDPGLAGSAIAFINMLVMLSGTVFQPLFGRMLDWFWSGGMADGLRVYAASDYQKVLTLVPMAFVISFIISLFIKETFAANRVSINQRSTKSSGNSMEKEKKQLIWACRRGMLELDLLLERFITQYYDKLDARQRAAFKQMLTQGDQELYAWFMGLEIPNKPEYKEIIAFYRAD